MANEITMSIRFEISNGYLKDTIDFGSVKITQSTIGGPVPGMVTVGTSEEAISFTDLATPGWVFIRNLDATNYVEFGPESSGSMVKMIKLKAGEQALFRLAGSVTLRGQANTGACKCLIKAFET